MNFLKGKKTYIVAAITFVLGGLQALGYHVPTEVFTLLGAVGLYALRSAVANVN